jgi:hypothetical protein
MRVEHGGHWAEVSEAPFTWRGKNRIRDAADGPFFESFAQALVQDRVTAWSEPGDPKLPEAWDAIDADFGDAILKASLNVWKAAPDPNATGSQSSDSRPEAPSETPTPSS